MRAPAIYDLDIGSDPDDSCVAWMVARDPERFRPALLITNDETRSHGRARFLARVIADAGSSLPIAAGLPSPRRRETCVAEDAGLVPDDDAAIELDGIAALVRVLSAHDRITYFGLGGLTNLATVLRLRPELASRIELVQMGPALIGTTQTVRPQYNARLDPDAMRRVLSAVASPTLVCSHTTCPRYC